MHSRTRCEKFVATDVNVGKVVRYDLTRVTRNHLTSERRKKEKI